MIEEFAGRKLPSLKVVMLWALWAFFVYWNAADLLSVRNDLAVVLDLCAVLAAVFLGGLVLNPLDWYNGRRAALGCMALAVMVARLSLTQDLLAYLPLRHADLVLLFLFVPPLMVILGGLVLVGLFLVVLGVLVALMALPSMLFGQIRIIRNELTTYRHEVHGLAGYIGAFSL